MKLKVLELFSGIGALSKALERLGIEHEIVDAVEIDKYAVKSFNAIHNTNFEPQDITQWDKDIEVDLIMHGSPCQDFSLAGKQAGGDEGSGTRSSLMYETIRIVKKLKPKYVIWENVKNLLSKNHKHNFDAYLETMEQLGYINYYQVLNAKDYGIPQNRERVFTVSILGNENYEFPNKEDEANLQDFLEKDTNVKTKPMCEKAFNKEYEQIITSDKDIYQCNVSSGYQDCKVGIKVSPTIRANNNCTHVLQRFEFPPKQELKLKLKDMLEDEVDEKYYLTDSMINYLENGKYQSSKVSNKLKQTETGISPTLDTMQGRNRQPFVKVKNAYLRYFGSKGKIQNKEYCDTLTASMVAGGGNVPIYKESVRIRKLTPKECWRLMGFDDEDFEKAKWYSKKETDNILGTNYPKNKSKKVFSKDGQLERMSDTQLYKQAGNSIVVNVLEAILTNLLK